VGADTYWNTVGFNEKKGKKRGCRLKGKDLGGRKGLKKELWGINIQVTRGRRQFWLTPGGENSLLGGPDGIVDRRGITGPVLMYSTGWETIRLSCEIFRSRLFRGSGQGGKFVKNRNGELGAALAKKGGDIRPRIAQKEAPMPVSLLAARG